MIYAFYCGKYKDKRADSTKESAQFFYIDIYVLPDNNKF